MRQILSIPNQLTFLRMFLVPLFITSLIYKRWILGLSLFVCAAVTDALDGFLARRLNQKTTLGTIMDPLADKIMMAASYITLSEFEVIPPWLTVAVVSRDVLLVGGVIILKLFSVDNVKIEPSKLGKATTFFQIITVIAALVHKIKGSSSQFFMYLLYLVTLIFTVVSGYQYFRKGLVFIYGNGGKNYKGNSQ